MYAFDTRTHVHPQIPPDAMALYIDAVSYPYFDNQPRLFPSAFSRYHADTPATPPRAHWHRDTMKPPLGAPPSRTLQRPGVFRKIHITACTAAQREEALPPATSASQAGIRVQLYLRRAVITETDMGGAMDGWISDPLRSQRCHTIRHHNSSPLTAPPTRLISHTYARRGARCVPDVCRWRRGRHRGTRVRLCISKSR
ncbi:hypothetical protein BJ912DRAFT_1141430 [Pholiota molesta]|nr:hypothetical protein BJ912DRAFT_1141430 [Pholiota molesta]